jgi:iron-sulfur cluster assembly protein
MSITLTHAALERTRSYLAANPNRMGLRFGVRRTGCSGWGYVIDLADHAGADDTVFEVDGVRIVVDAASLPLVQGTRIDFVKQGLNSQFAFDNPNAAEACGCGESFTTKAA